MTASTPALEIVEHEIGSIEVNRDGSCRWTDVANALTHIRAQLSLLPAQAEGEGEVMNRLQEIVLEMLDEAENISPKRGHSNGTAHPAPMLRRWANKIKKITRRLSSPPTSPALREEIARTLYKSRGQFDDVTVDIHFNWFYDPYATQYAEARMGISHCYRDADAVLALLSRLPAQAVGDTHLPLEPSENMLIAARNWSSAKYGKPIGNEAARECWRAMYGAAPTLPSPPAEPSGEMVEAEREACAKIADERADALSFSGGANTTMSIPCRRIACDIRARAALSSAGEKRTAGDPFGGDAVTSAGEKNDG